MADPDGDDAAAALRLVLPALIDGLPAVLERVVAVLEYSWPGSAEFLVLHRGEVIGAGQLAIRQIVQTAEQALIDGTLPSPVDTNGGLALFEELGREQWRVGASLESLRSAYQAGARSAWRQMAQIAARFSVPATAVALLADAVFALVDHLAAASARGYAEEQSSSTSARERARQDLVDLLLSDRSDSRLIEVTAQRAGWPLPSTAATVLVPDDPLALDRLARLGPLCLPLRRADAVGVVVPDPAGPGRRLRLAATLGGAAAVIGASVRLDQLPAELRVTQVAARLRNEGALEGDPLFVDEHLDAVIVQRDTRLLEELQTQVLAPLQSLSPEARTRLSDTLASWLSNLGDRQQVAAELHIHRPTVR